MSTDRGWSRSVSAQGTFLSNHLFLQTFGGKICFPLAPVIHIRVDPIFCNRSVLTHLCPGFSSRADTLFGKRSVTNKVLLGLRTPKRLVAIVFILAGLPHVSANARLRNMFVRGDSELQYEQALFVKAPCAKICFSLAPNDIQVE